MLPKSLRTQIAGLLSLAILLLPAVQPGGWVNTAAATGSDSHPLLAAYCGRSTAALQARTLALLGEVQSPTSPSTEHCSLCLVQLTGLVATAPGLAVVEATAVLLRVNLSQRLTRSAPAPRARAPPPLSSLS